MKRKYRVLSNFLWGFLVLCLLSSLLSFIFFQLYFDRNDIPRYNIEISYSDISVEKYPRESISFYSGNNQLNGHIYNKDSQKGIVVFAHGIDSGEETYLTTVTYLLDRDWGVLTFNGTGTRTSEGEGIVGLSQTKLDVKAALEYIESEDDLKGKPVLLYGHSMGGYAVTSVLAEDVQVAGVVSIAPFNSPFEVLFYQTHSLTGPFAYFLFPFLATQHYLRFGEESNISAVKGIQKENIPILVIYGTEDEIVPQDKIGILAHQDELQDSNVTFIAVDEPYRNRHATSWLSSEAAEYSLEVWKEYEIYKTGSESLKVEFGSFQKEVDIEKMNQVDSQLLQIIDQFLSDASKGE